MRVSIITLTIDSSDYVDEAIGSVEHQGPYELEHIVVHDGADGFIRRLAQKYPHIKFVGGAGPALRRRRRSASRLRLAISFCSFTATTEFVRACLPDWQARQPLVPT